MSEQEHYSGGGEKTIAKTVILDKYLQAYLNIMKKPYNWSGPKWYIDTHAGTGFTRERGVEIPGSAQRALKHDFDRFYLYEKDTSHFKLLVETLNENTEASLDFIETAEGEPPIARSEDPFVEIRNMNCNQGVKQLVDESGSDSHWFTFVDPEKLTVERELMENLCDRENMDILLNFQTSAYVRNARDSAEHSLDTVEENLGRDFPRGAEPDEYVEYCKQDLFGEDWIAASRPMQSESKQNSWRYDLIFASQNRTAINIITDIYDGDLKNDVTDEIKAWRSKSDVAQSGMESYVELPVEEDDDDDQAELGDF